MKRIYVRGTGAVSPAGWGVAPLMNAVRSGVPLPVAELPRPGNTISHRVHRVRRVPAPSPRPAFLAEPRLRRSSPISQFLVGAALEALGPDVAAVRDDLSLGVISCVMAGCVGYSRRFYDETWRDPATASPLVFPETVFNAPAAHLGALLGASGPNYTLVGDAGVFPQAVALAANWLAEDRVDACLVVGAEECDWLTAEAARLFQRQILTTEGAAALYLRRESASARAELVAVSEPQTFTTRTERQRAALALAKAFGHGQENDLLVAGDAGVGPGSASSPTLDRDEAQAWAQWRGTRRHLRPILGEGFAAAGGWQCVVACESLALQEAARATVSVVGCNQQAIGVQFAAIADT